MCLCKYNLNLVLPLCETLIFEIISFDYHFIDELSNLLFRPWQSSWSVSTGIYHKRQSKHWSCWANGSPWMWKTLWNFCHLTSPTQQCGAMLLLGFSRLMMRYSLVCGYMEKSADLRIFILIESLKCLLLFTTF